MNKKLRRKANWIYKCIGFLFPLLLFLAENNSVIWAAEKSYPTKPINVVFAYAPGGPVDIGTKVIADRIGKILGQPLVIIYKPGGGGTLGTAFVVKSKPDGYTLLSGSSSGLVLSPIVKKIDYKLEDFDFIGMFGESVIWLVVKAEARWKTLKDFVEEAKRSPGQLKISSFGKLSASDFVIELLNKEADIKLKNVPYRSSAEATTAVLGGHADAAMVIVSGSHVESGLFRALALSGEQRWGNLPNIPTFKELGYPIEYSTWLSLCVPRGAPKGIVDKLCVAHRKAYEIYQKEIEEELRKVDIRAVYLNPEETLTKYKKQYEVIYRIAEELGVVAK